jgi:hypothetical protein
MSMGRIFLQSELNNSTFFNHTFPQPFILLALNWTFGELWVQSYEWWMGDIT